MIFVKILDTCVKMLKVQYSSHFVDLLFFGNITITLLLKLSGIFPVVYKLLVRQYKIYFISSSACNNNSAGMLSTPYDFFFNFNSFNAFSNSDFVIGGPSSSGVISSLSNSSVSSESLYNSSTHCCHLSAIFSSSVRVFPSFDLITVFFFYFGCSK